MSNMVMTGMEAQDDKLMNSKLRTKMNEMETYYDWPQKNSQQMVMMMTILMPAYCSYF